MKTHGLAQRVLVLCMGQHRIYSETLREASRTLGGATRLASRLNVTIDELNKWIGGEEEPPLHVFLDSLEIIAEAPWRVERATEAA